MDFRILDTSDLDNQGLSLYLEGFIHSCGELKDYLPEINRELLSIVLVFVSDLMKENICVHEGLFYSFINKIIACINNTDSLFECVFD